MRIIRVLGSGGSPGINCGQYAVGGPREEFPGLSAAVALAELFNKKIKTDVWALGVGSRH